MTSERTPTKGEPGASGLYEIRLAGRLDRRWASWFDGLVITSQADGSTVVAGPIPDQAALHGVLQRVRDLGLTLLSVTTLEDDRGGGG
ncbi:MAG TPA: hypothetical protein VI277_01555 [Candidatus Limnocylindria bacterium]